MVISPLYWGQEPRQYGLACDGDVVINIVYILEDKGPGNGGLSGDEFVVISWMYWSKGVQAMVVWMVRRWR